MALMKKTQFGKTYYESSSGTKYQYDLSNPSDKLAYSIDLEAQMRDKMSSNLYRTMENGGGILE